jgi:hypothetical protein
MKHVHLVVDTVGFGFSLSGFKHWPYNFPVSQPNQVALAFFVQFPHA